MMEESALTAQFKPESKDKMEMEKIKLYTEEMESMYEEMGGSLEESEDDEPEEGQPCDWIAELKKFQDACTRAAEKTAEAEKGKKKGRGRSTQTKAEAKRASVGKWNRIATQATKWNGKLTPGKKEWSNTTFAKVPQIEQDPKVRAAVAWREAGDRDGGDGGGERGRSDDQSVRNTGYGRLRNGGRERMEAKTRQNRVRERRGDEGSTETSVGDQRHKGDGRTHTSTDAAMVEASERPRHGGRSERAGAYTARESEETILENPEGDGREEHVPTGVE